MLLKFFLYKQFELDAYLLEKSSILDVYGLSMMKTFFSLLCD